MFSLGQSRQMSVQLLVSKPDCITNTQLCSDFCKIRAILVCFPKQHQIKEKIFSPLELCSSRDGFSENLLVDYVAPSRIRTRSD